MKFGKKKSKESAQDQTPEQSPVEQSSKSQEPVAKRGRRLGSVALQQALAVLLAGVVAVLAVYFLSVMPAAEKRHEASRQVEADSAQQRLNRYFTAQQDQVQAIASQPHVLRGLAGDTSAEVLAGQLQNALPGASAVFVFLHGDIPRAGNNGSLLGFAGAELARRAEKGLPLQPDAFPRDGVWYIQFAAPVRNPVSNAVVGTVLAVFDADILQPMLTVSNGRLGGQLALVQTISGSSGTVASAGNGNGPSETRTLTNPDWSVVYQAASAPEPVVSPMALALLIGIPALLAAVLVWMLLAAAQRSIREDMSALIQWAHKAFVGERLRLPALHWDTVASAGEVLHRLSLAVDSRVNKAGENGNGKPARASALASDSAAPMFQDDIPDVDMMDGDEDVLGFGDAPMFDDELFDEDEPVLAETTQVDVRPEIFRAYDIRGIVGDNLTEDVVEVIGRAIGSEATDRGVTSLCIGYDGRYSSPGLADALARGVLSTGCSVIEVGAVPTPVLYFAAHHLETGSGVMVTGSHNPANYNGLKIMLGGETLSGDAIQKLYDRIQNADFSAGQGELSREDVRRAYLDRIVGDIAVAAPLKVVVDAGNGIAGELGPMLLEELGCEVTPLHCDVDGDFPNHHPDPGKPENLQDLIAKVQETGADIGLAFDGDGDRLGVVTNSGKIIWPDRLLMLFARDVVSRNPGADVLYDVKCSRRLAGVISEAGGRPIMWKSGHSLMKAKMQETGALLAGELSGHIFFAERWYGFDDGLYTAARLLEILGIEDRHSDEVFEDFPEDISTPELNVQVTESDKFAIIERLEQQADFGDGNVSTIDGLRVDYTDGWGLCRASNTTPVLVLRFEAENEDALERIKSVFREQLQKAAPDLVAEF
ncbi:phosphomannomutase/phosphoglucomutase [Marinobacter sp. P4B1]|uniref:phosphomannomutase/phosphoglucomutase n=1 Tax=Marinobacter sp. P4B1 TaxID=1119533 RepID=UPI00071CC2E9|nr:phosphomannomutase/phosphoglucomutase [Marinobacter sp. P4B1]KRW81057.1 phosphomannomutase [Marinobacter sp. P4B1]